MDIKNRKNPLVIRYTMYILLYLDNKLCILRYRYAFPCVHRTYMQRLVYKSSIANNFFIFLRNYVSIHRFLNVALEIPSHKHSCSLPSIGLSSALSSDAFYALGTNSTGSWFFEMRKLSMMTCGLLTDHPGFQLMPDSMSWVAARVYFHH